MNYKSRTQKFRQYMDDNGLKAAIVSRPMNQYYLTGFITISYSRTIATIIEHDKTSMILPGFVSELAEQTSNADAFYTYFEHPDEADKGLDYTVHLNAILSKYGKGAKIGAELGVISAAFADKLRENGYELVEIGSFIMSMRQIKESEELDIFREGGRIASIAVAKTIEHSKVGNTEIDIDQAGTVAATMEVIKRFPNAITDKFTMSPSGVERTCLPHVMSSVRKLEPTDMVLHNRQLIINGYHTECQRTYFLGKVTDKQKDLFNIMLESNHATLESVKAGVRASDVDAAGRNVLKKHGLAHLFNHRIGKGCGLEMLEEPFIRFDNDAVLQENMVISLHPGFYVKGSGGFRHSDTLIVTKSGYEIVTDYPKELKDLIFEG